MYRRTYLETGGEVYGRTYLEIVSRGYRGACCKSNALL